MLAGYRALTRTLPRRFREEYGEEMCAVVDEHWQVVRRTRNRWGRIGFWLRQSVAVLRAAVVLRLVAWSDGGAALPGGAALLERELAATRVVDRHFAARGVRERRSGVMNGLWKDVEWAFRSLRKHPGFTAVTVLTLGLGIGLATAIFSVVHAVLIRELPYGDPQGIVTVHHVDTESGARAPGVSAANIRDLRDASRRLSEVAVAEPWSLDLQVEGRTESLRAWAVSEGFFDVLGARALAGRTFTAQEHREGARVVVLGHRTWIARFGGDPAVVGRTFTFQEEPWTVVGVLPAAFKFPDRAEVWVPRVPSERDERSRAADFMTGVARLAPGSTVAEARDEAVGVARALAEAHPTTNGGLAFELVPLREGLLGDVRTPLLVLFAAVGFVLLIACSNVAGLMLARGVQREREYALRSALGAGTGRLVRQITMESLFLAAGGCLLGIVLTHGGVRAIRGLGPDHLPRIDEIGVDGTVLIFAVLAAGLSALLSGVAPSLRLSRPDLRGSLSEGGRGSGDRRGQRLRNRLVVLEVGTAVVLLIGAGLLFRSFATLTERELGFDPDDRLVVQAFAFGYPPGELTAFVEAAVENLGAIPGVERVALASTVPGATDGIVAGIDVPLPFRREDRPAPPEGQEPVAWVVQVSAGYFEVLDIPVRAGRGFDEEDRADAPPVVVVNEALARRQFPDGSPVGRRISLPWGGWTPREIVGVVGDVRPMGYESEPRPEVYLPLSQLGTGNLTFVLRTTGEAAGLTRPAMHAIWQVNPAQAVWGAASLESLVADWLRERRFNLLLLVAFAGSALLLAAVGIYGLVSFSVEQRVAELGIRRALGGRTADILGMVLAQGATLAAGGIGLGLVAALLLTRVLRGMLFGVEATDPPTYVILALAVFAVATLATLGPALRATRVEPSEALRAE